MVERLEWVRFEKDANFDINSLRVIKKYDKKESKIQILKCHIRECTIMYKIETYHESGLQFYYHTPYADHDCQEDLDSSVRKGIFKIATGLLDKGVKDIQSLYNEINKKYT